MDKRYYSVDVELSGKEIGKHSMLSLGAAIVSDREKTFYRELKPISWKFETMAMRAASMGLECLTPAFRKIPYYDPEHRDFRPQLVLKLLTRYGVAPLAAMNDFLRWVNITSIGYKPIFLAKPVRVDVPAVLWYLKKFAGEISPFELKGHIDLIDAYHKAIGKGYTSLRELGLVDTRPHLHNALDDSIYQAEQFEKILQIIRENNSCNFSLTIQ